MKTRRLRLLLLSGILIVGALGVAQEALWQTGATAAPIVNGQRITLTLQKVAQGLHSPLLVTNAGDGSGRLFIVEQGGVIRVLSGGRLAPTLFLDLSGLTAAGGERGLLGLTFHLHYRQNGRLFVNYTDLHGDTVIAEYRRSRVAMRADPASARILLRIQQPYPNHNGGNILFGPDGYLYIGMGDGGSGGDPQGNGQRLDTLLGKMLRIDVDRPGGGTRYSIPPTNPFVHRAGARPEIWAYGLRNPWRFSFDPVTHDLWIGDVGQNAIEEIDRAPGTTGGLNYGWNRMEGAACYQPSTGCSTAGLVLPITQYTHAHGCSVTGGFVYRGRAHPAWRGVYFFADYCSGTIWGIASVGPNRQTPVVLLHTSHAVTSFGADQQGELYLCDGSAGTVWRIT
jgi:glucose/arabinose dehydrogenase